MKSGEKAKPAQPSVIQKNKNRMGAIAKVTPAKKVEAKQVMNVHKKGGEIEEEYI